MKSRHRFNPCIPRDSVQQRRFELLTFPVCQSKDPLHTVQIPNWASLPPCNWDILMRFFTTYPPSYIYSIVFFGWPFRTLTQYQLGQTLIEVAQYVCVCVVQAERDRQHKGEWTVLCRVNNSGISQEPINTVGERWHQQWTGLCVGQMQKSGITLLRNIFPLPTHSASRCMERDDCQCRFYQCSPIFSNEGDSRFCSDTYFQLCWETVAIQIEEAAHLLSSYHRSLLTDTAILKQRRRDDQDRDIVVETGHVVPLSDSPFQ